MRRECVKMVAWIRVLLSQAKKQDPEIRIGISTPRGSEGIGLCRHQNSDFRAMKDYLCYVSLLVCATEFKKAPKTSEIKKKCNSLMKYFVIKD